MPGRSDDCIPAFIEPLRSSKHRAFATDPLLLSRPAQPRRAPCDRKAPRWRKGRGKPSSCVGSSSLRFPLPPLRPEAPRGLRPPTGLGTGRSQEREGGPRWEKGDHHHAREEDRALPALERRLRHRRAAASVLRVPGLPPAQLRQLRVGPHLPGRRQLLRRHAVGRHRPLHR